MSVRAYSKTLYFKGAGRVSSAALVAVFALDAALAAHLPKAAARFKSSLAAPFAVDMARPELDAAEPVTGIIVLGGGFDRTREGVRLSRRHPDAILVISGATDKDYAYAIDNAAAPDRVLIEPNATTTFENARYTKLLLNPQAGERWLLVTSSAHMRRAYATFDGAGFPVTPWPVHDLAPGHPLAAEIATHEMLGLISYRLLGRTRQFWPALNPA